jgi:HK97 family phage major capsid protein
MKKVYLAFGSKKSYLPKIQSRRLQLRNFANVSYKSDGNDDDDDSDDVLVAVKELGKKHQKQIDEVKGLIKDETTKAKDEIKGDFETRITEAKGASQKALEKAEDIEKKMATSGFGGNGGATKSYEKEIEEKLTAHKEQLSKGAKFTIEFDRKAVGNMTSSGNLTGSYFVPPTNVPGVFIQPYNEVHMRNLLPIGNTTSNTIRYVRDNGGEGGPAMVAEGGSKPQMDRDLAILDANVRKIATHLRLPEEMIEDVPYITSFLTNVGTQEVLAVEDTQILYGDGTGQNLSGLFTNATAFAAPATAIVASPNRFDVLRAARLQMRRAKRMPSFALVSPLDYYMMTSVKDTTGNYVLQGGGNGLIPTLDGVPVIEMNQVVDNDFLLGDRNAAEIDFRSNITVRFYEQDQDNAIKNLVTIVIEERIALPIYYATGFIKGTFTAAITDLTS